MSSEVYAPSDERRLRSLLDGMGECLVALGSDWRITEFNRPAELHLGFGRNEVVGRPFLDVFPQASADFLQRLRRVRATGEAEAFEIPSFVRPDTDIEVHVSNWDDAIAISFHDISGAGQARAALRESRVRLEIATAAAELGVWEYNFVTGVMVYSERARAILGLPADGPVTLKMIRGLTHPEDRARTAEAARRATDPILRERGACEYRILRVNDGELRWVLAHGEVVFGRTPAGYRATRYIGTLQDITERHRAEAAVRESETRLRLAVEAGRMAIWAYDIATKEIEATPELNRVLGFPERARPTLAEIDAAYYPGEQARIRQVALEALARGQRFFQAEYRWMHPGGGLRWHMLRAEVQLDAAGIPATVLGVLLDITERKQAEARQQMLIHELNHRVKNTLATVQSLAVQSFRGGGSPAEMREAFESRLMALSRAHDVLTRSNWTGAGLYGVVDEVIEPYRERVARFTVDGPDLLIAPRLALSLSMALHELATNAVKYGALSVPGGRVSITWTSAGEEPQLLLIWREIGGPAVAKPTRQGFGTRLIRRGLAAEIGGAIDLEFLPEGVVCTITAPLQAPPAAEDFLDPERADMPAALPRGNPLPRS